MKTHVVSIIMVLLILVAFGQAQTLGQTSVTVASFEFPLIQAAPRPSAEFAVHRVNTGIPDARGQQLLLYAAEAIPWDIMIRAIRSIVPDSDIHVIIEVPSEAAGGARYGSRHQHSGPPLFFALLSAPEVNRNVPGVVPANITRNDRVIHLPEFVPAAAPPLSHGGSVGMRGPRK